MPLPKISTHDLTAAESQSEDSIRDFLRAFENRQGRVVCDWELFTAGADGLNRAYFKADPDLPAASDVEVLSFPDTADVDLVAGQSLADRGHRALIYGPAWIAGARKLLLVSRPGQEQTLRGKMSTFGGPRDSGMRADEGLAIVGDSDLRAVPGVAELFLDSARGALGRNLANDASYYIACRWNYAATPRAYLAATDVKVRNPLTGKTLPARPVDWGPALWTDRLADLSDKLAKDLGLQTDSECEVIVPLPAGPAAVPVAAGVDDFRIALIRTASRQLSLFGGTNEADPPLRNRIEAYWDELRQATGNQDFRFTSVSTAWSAVFVSWCVRQAGPAAADFQASPRHSEYVHAAIARAGKGEQTFVALPIDQYAPQPGDIIHRNREGGRITYAAAGTNDQYVSHGAIVVGLSRDARGPCAVTIGGNESDTVRTNKVILGADGKISQRSDDPYICVLKTT